MAIFSTLPPLTRADAVISCLALPAESRTGGFTGALSGYAQLHEPR
jgi:hypothetical protein